MTLAAYLLAFLTAVYPGAAQTGEAGAVIAAVTEAVQRDTAPPVFGSREADGAVLVVGTRAARFGLPSSRCRAGETTETTRERPTGTTRATRASVSPPSKSRRIRGRCRRVLRGVDVGLLA
jgi:hypothetical protein